MDTEEGQFEFRRTSAEPAGHAGTLHQDGSGARGPGFKSRAPDQLSNTNPMIPTVASVSLRLSLRCAHYRFPAKCCRIRRTVRP